MFAWEGEGEGEGEGGGGVKLVGFRSFLIESTLGVKWFSPQSGEKMGVKEWV